MKRNELLCGLAAALLAAAAAGCKKSDMPPSPDAEPASDVRRASTSGAAIPSELLTVCNTLHGQTDNHKPRIGASFRIVETVENSGVYALDLTDPNDWAPGWRSLTLAKVGDVDARIPHDIWTDKCRKGDQSQSGPFAPTERTIRLRGQTCLPAGIPDPVRARCQDGDDDPGNDALSFHEIVIYVHAPSSEKDIAHVMMQYCGRHELEQNKRLFCDDPHRVPAARTPHPGHVHIQP